MVGYEVVNTTWLNAPTQYSGEKQNSGLIQIHATTYCPLHRGVARGLVVEAEAESGEKSCCF